MYCVSFANAKIRPAPAITIFLNMARQSFSEVAEIEVAVTPVSGRAVSKEADGPSDGFRRENSEPAPPVEPANPLLHR